MSLKTKTQLQPSEVAARFAEFVAGDNAHHGYSQPGRWGDGGIQTADLGDNTILTLHDGDFDCTSLSIGSYMYQDINTGEATYSLDMYKLLDTGNFIRVPVSERRRGDILVTTARRHAAIYLGDDMIAEAHASEYGTIDGQTGDQTGEEIRVISYWNDYYDDWSACYRCTVTRNVTGWIFNDEVKKWWYKHEDGSYTTNDWEYINGNWYHFDAEGWMSTGWVLDNRKWFYCDLDSGAMRTGWLKYKNDWYWLYPDTGKPRGATAASSCVYINGKWYAFDSTGKMLNTIQVNQDGSIKF